jgi:hypothetical protein
MNTPEEIIKAEMRLYALECLVCQLYAFLGRTLPPGMIEETQKQWIDGAKKKGFGGDPAFSDLLSAELEDALKRLVEMQNFYLGKSDKKPPAKHG